MTANTKNNTIEMSLGFFISIAAAAIAPLCRRQIQDAASDYS
jgi:hypothetical protein